MKVMIEPSTTAELERLIAMLHSMEIGNFEISDIPQPSITKGDKSLDPTGLFGIWKDAPRQLADVRTQAWTRKS